MKSNEKKTGSGKSDASYYRIIPGIYKGAKGVRPSLERIERSTDNLLWRKWIFLEYDG